MCMNNFYHMNAVLLRVQTLIFLSIRTPPFTLYIEFMFWRTNWWICTFDFHRLSWLPVVEDEDEAPHVYGYLCDLIEANHPVVLGPNNANLPRLISFFAEAFNKDVVSADNPVKARMLVIVRQIQVRSSINCNNCTLIFFFFSLDVQYIIRFGFFAISEQRVDVPSVHSRVNIGTATSTTRSPERAAGKLRKKQRLHYDETKSLPISKRHY